MPSSVRERIATIGAILAGLTRGVDAHVVAARDARARDAAGGYIDLVRVWVEVCCGTAIDVPFD